MGLNTIVKVSAITNLSDARYCAGMGVDMLGFNVVENSPNYVSPTFFQELRGWFTGPKVVAEIYGLRAAAELPSILESYKPDLLELSTREWSLVKDTVSIPIVLQIHPGELIPSLPAGSLLIDSSMHTNYKTLFDSNNNVELAQQALSKNFAGLIVYGTPELQAGQKTYEGLADILEMLDA